MNIIVSLFCGIIFGIGLVISEMINPVKVLGFLNMPTKRLRRGVFNICGITDVVYKRYFAVPFVSDEKRKKFLEDVEKTAKHL